MPHWIALLPGQPTSEPDAEAPSPAQAMASMLVPGPLSALHLGWWALQFTPRVALLEDAAVLEVQASERLFGGTRALLARIVQEAAKEHGLRSWAHAETALAAVALARRGDHTKGAGSAAQASPEAADAERDIGLDLDLGLDIHDDTAAQARLARRLDTLPLDVLTGVAEHAATLARLGCRTLADVRALPRGGLSRRFGAVLLQTLDQAYGLLPQPFEWLVLPPIFDARLELPGRIESAPAMLFAANRLLQELCAWLAGRQAAACAFTLRWRHDWQRRDSAQEGEWTVRLASPSRDLQRLSRLLAEHLQRIQLSAPVGEISLHADEIEALPLSSFQLFQEHREDLLSAKPDALLTPAAQRAQRDALLALLDKLSVRLSPERVLQAQLRPDHRLECMQTWQAALQAQAAPHGARAAGPQAKPRPGGMNDIADLPQPNWLLPQPMPLALAAEHGLREHPSYQGKLTLLAGPHRVEAGWWDAQARHERVTRDYYLASSPHAGLLWIFKAQQAPDATGSPWFLHGFFA